MFTIETRIRIFHKTRKRCGICYKIVVCFDCIKKDLFKKIFGVEKANASVKIYLINISTWVVPFNMAYRIVRIR